jgi:hypothetical protein
MWFWPVNRMSLRPGLLWTTLNLALIIQCLSRNNILFYFYIPCKVFSHTPCLRVTPGVCVPQVQNHWSGTHRWSLAWSPQEAVWTGNWATAARGLRDYMKTPWSGSGRYQKGTDVRGAWVIHGWLRNTVYCENRTEHTGNTLRLRYRDQPVNVKVKVKVTLRQTYESASPSWRQAPIWDPRPN